MSKRRKIIPYNPKLKLLARELRNHSTRTEVRLWQYLSGKQMMGYDFHGQKPLDNFIADFFKQVTQSAEYLPIRSWLFCLMMSTPLKVCT